MSDHDNAAIQLEESIAEAIREYERRVPSRLCIGVSVTRFSRAELQIAALIVPKYSSHRPRTAGSQASKTLKL